MKVIRFFAALLLWGSLGLAAKAQTYTGAINGTVTDPSGAVVPNAEVKATNKATGVGRTTTTTSDGEFAFSDLPIATYTVVVTAQGFPVMTVDEVSVTQGSIYTLPVKLSLSQQATTVEVSAASLSLDTTTQTQTTTLPNSVVQDIPLNGRDFTQLITITPGYAGYAVGGFGSVNGTRPNQVNWQIDGVDNNDFWHNIPAVNQGGVSGIAGVVMPIDAIDEFSAQTQSSAEAGRNPGGVVNLAIKSGGNEIHGTAYYYNRNEYYAASSPFYQKTDVSPKPPRLRNENYGGSVGGPIWKDHTFFFTTFEKQDYIIGLSGLATEVSTPWVNQALTLLNTYGVPVNQISTNLLGALYPGNTSTAPGLWPASIAGLSATENNFFSSSPSTGYSYNGLVKLDHNFNEKEHLSVRGFMGQGSQTAPLGTSTALATASSNLSYYFEKAPIHVQNYAIVLNSALTPRLTNQILFGVNYFNQTFRDANASFDTVALGLNQSPDALINGKPILGAPNIVIGGFEQVGITPPEGRNDETGMLTDIVSWTLGKHQFRFGGEVRQGRVDEFYFRHSLGNYTFDGTQGPWAANCPDTNTCALADFLAGYISTGNLSVGDAERHVTVNGFNFFAQDQWQVTRKLNLNLGLRYEYFGPLHNDDKDLAVFIPGQGLVIQGDGINSIFPPDKNNVAPRFGFAYKPTSKDDLVVRGGFGVFYDQININPFLDYRPPNGAADGLEGNPAGPHAVSSYSAAGTDGSFQWQPGVALFPGIAICTTGNVASEPSCGNNTFGIYSVSQNFRAPYIYNFNLQVEKSVGKYGLLQVGYVGSDAHKLSVMLNINQANLTTGIRPYAAQYPNYGDINQLNSIGDSNYHSLQATFKTRNWHGLDTQFSYTYGHELDYVTEYRGTIPLDSTNLAAEYGNGDFDTRHNFVAAWNYVIPGSSWGPKILTHGWQLTSLWSFHTGQPFNPTGVTSRPGLDVIADPFAGVDHKFSAANGGEPWINPAAFCVPGAAGCTGPTDPLGNLSRNKYYGPSFKDVDFSVFKNIPITERVKIQLRAEMYNLFNRINLASGAGSVGGNGYVSDTIGDFNGAPGLGPGEPFNMQLVAKIIF
jgi:carboxypeptidase family protein/TonB-dependent receptor-like protein